MLHGYHLFPHTMATGNAISNGKGPHLKERPVSITLMEGLYFRIWAFDVLNSLTFTAH